MGYCAIGRRNAEITPASVITSAITVAKIGRSMKKRNMRDYFFPVGAVAAVGAAAAGAVVEPVALVVGVK